jgi:nitrate reductase delta subunit
VTDAGRWELFRALGAVADSPAAARTACAALGCVSPGGTGPGAAEHTAAFVLNCPPYASVYLGAEGGLGGEAADRAAGFWRALGLDPPTEPDHLSALLGLYASLGEAAGEGRLTATADALTRARHALFWEHLWSWLPGYLDAVADLGLPGLVPWARLARRALQAERGAHPGGRLPLALRDAPGPGADGDGLGAMLATLTAPVLSGFVLTRRSLASGADAAGAGHRIGERRFTLRAMLEQSPAATFNWLAAEATRWSRRYAGPDGFTDPILAWWAGRAEGTARWLAAAAGATNDACAPELELKGAAE